MDSVQIISKVVSRKREGVYSAPTSSGGGGGTTIVEGDKSASIMLAKLFTALTADNVEVPVNDTTSEIKRIRANFDFFSVGDVSAKGIGAGSGEGGNTGGATTLGGLLNVGAWADEVPTVDRIMYQPAGGTHWTSKSLSEIISGKEYATKEELNAVNAKIDNFLTGTDTDNIINKWVELEAFLAGMSESSTLSSLLQNKADKSITISAGAGLSGGGDLSANRTLSLAASGISAGTYTKVTVDVYGRVTGGTSLVASDIPGLPWSKITSGKPTTLSGYGITDAYTKEVSDARFLQKATFNDLFEKVNIGTSAAPIYAIKAKYTLYSVGDIVAKGIGGDTGTGSPGSLESLLDVSLTAPSSGEVLMYNGSHWVNSEIQQGLDTSAMWAELKKSDSANVINISHIPNIGWAKITGKPTTLAGYGITDGVNSVTLSGSGNAVTGMSFSGHSLTLTKGATFLDITAMWNALKAADTSKVIDISHIPSIGWGKITGKPTTLAGYGITDGINSVTLSGSGNAITGMSFSGHSLTLTKGATFLAKATFDDLFEKVNIGTSSAPVYAIKAKYTFYSVGDVVAKGIDADSGAGAGGSLSGLIDVTLTSPASGQILMYNGSHWVNSTIQQGLDVSAMWTELKKSDAANVINISHIPGLPWAKITSGKPTTLAGYGITDAYTKAQADSKYVTALGTSGNYLTWTKNGTVNNITVPYATNADTVDGYHATMLLRSVGRDSATLDLNTYIDRTVKEIRTTEQTTTNSPFSGFGVLVNLMDGSSTAGYAKLQIAVAAGGNMYFRSHQSSAASITTAWRTVVDSVNRASLLDSFYVKKTGDTMTGILTMANAQPIILNQSSATSLQYIRFGCADNDFARIAAGGTASNAGWLEIATADDGNEPIYARQYTGVYSNLVRTATLLDASGNTQFPGTVQANYFTCRNTTLCTNLNANYLEGYTNMGFIHSNFSAQTGSTAYVSGDTHRMKVAEIGINTHYSSYVLLLSHEFWGHQHYSALLLHIAVTNNDNSGNKNPRCAVHVMSRTGNNGNINPVYYKVENNKAYIYIEVYGGNSYGNWNTTVLQARDSITTNNANSRGNLKLTFEFNQPTANMVAANYNNYINAMGFMDGSNQNTFVRKAGDSMTGDLTSTRMFRSTFSSTSWINSASNAIITANITSYGGIWCANTKNGRVVMSVYPSNDDKVYLGYANTAQINAGTNGFNTQTYWNADNSFWYAGGYQKANSSDSYVLLGGGGHKALSTMQSEYDARYVNVTGDTMTGLLTLKTGSSHTGIKCGNSYMSAIDGSVIFQNNAGGIRFSTVDNWDWNVWAGLKYVHSSKTVYLGLADGTIFTTNTAQTGGTVSMVNCKVQADYYLARNTTLCTNLNADLLDSKHESAFTSIIGRHSFNTDGTAPYAYIHLFRIANSHGYSTLRVDIDFKSRNHAATLYIDIVANQYPYNSGGTSINIYKETKSGRTCTFYVKQTIQSSNYNYYDIYYNSGAWNTGSYDVKLRGINGGFIFEPKNQKINSLPSGYSTVTETSFFGNAASANQLYTARTINGTSFNGTANITTSYWGTTRTFYTNSHDSYGASAGVNVNGSGNVTLLLPSSIRCSNWFRSTGNTGWYNQTYSGGIYMDDYTYVKVYNNKSFYVSGNILATGDVMAKSNSSDIRLKKDIQGYDAMSIIRGFRSVRYHWNEEAKKNSVIFAHDKWNFGLIAQDLLQGGYDQWVSDVFKDYYTISYERLIPVLWKGVQEVDNEVVSLRRRVEYLENEIKRLCA